MFLKFNCYTKPTYDVSEKSKCYKCYRINIIEQNFFLETSYVSFFLYYLNNFLFSIFYEEFLIHLFKKKKIFDKYNLILNH